MATFTQRLAAGLHLGRLPAAQRVQLESEGRLLYLAEGIWETAILRRYRAPGAFSWRQRFGNIGYFVLSEHRLVARAKGGHEIDVNMAYDDPPFQKLTFAIQPKYLSLTFDPSTQNPQASGQIEIRLHLPDVDMAAEILERAGAQMESREDEPER